MSPVFSNSYTWLENDLVLLKLLSCIFIVLLNRLFEKVNIKKYFDIFRFVCR